ncbi:J domain-containing protein [Halorubrum laminariae]|uniref:J domain-containing protein n=1 Tax=Halorubrum laminariae TaxID=1433523 RepID=A0ABD6BWE5_9EURY|nr:J domain-containing protein [Halorubrum laminariae]
MVVESVTALPAWVLLGVAAGVVASVVVALVFYLGDRLIAPGGSADDESGHTGDERRRREIREYLTATEVRFTEDHALGEVRVPFYLPDRDVAITFDAHDYFRLEGEGVYTVLCEHEMPGRGLGRRLPFEVTEPDWGTRKGYVDAPTPDPVAAAFDELDVPRDADGDEVKRAYRERVKETHPDQGGDEEAFRRVREAYATARNHAGDRGDPGGETSRESGAANQRDRAPRSRRERRSRHADPPTGFGR